MRRFPLENNRLFALLTATISCTVPLLSGCGSSPEEPSIAETASALTVADCPAGSNIIVGTTGNDIIDGTNGDDCIVGLGGNDVLRGHNGDDVLIGGDDNDVLEGGNGKDTLYGEDGDDQLLGGTGKDEIWGGNGNDIVRGENGGDKIKTGAGNDVVIDCRGPNDVDGGEGTDVCSGVNCEVAPPTKCGSCTPGGNDCPGGTICLAETGLCVGCLSDSSCDDQNVCTNDACVPTLGCQHDNAPDETPCNDRNACTQSDSCVSGICQGSDPVTCVAKDYCHVAGECDPATGVCSDPNAPDATPCNDGNTCTENDTCQGGSCGGTAIACAPPGVCQEGGVCLPGSGCAYTNKPDGTDCTIESNPLAHAACDGGVCIVKPPRGPTNCSSATWGDPHIVTWDGLMYDLQAEGEFVLASDGQDFNVQVRLESVADDVSIVSAVAMQLDGHNVTFSDRESPPVRIDGVPTTIPATGYFFADGSRIDEIAPDQYQISYAGGQDVLIDTMPTIDARPLAVRACRGNPQPSASWGGLLGNADGAAGNDLASNGGGALTAPVSFANLTSFADSWRITSQQSYFYYAPGTNTGTYQDLSFPSGPVSASSLDAATRANATSICAAAGVTNSWLLDACVLDVGKTGEADYALMYASIPAPTFVFDSDGDNVQDSSDNCPSVANANQADVNGNGLGDACEVVCAAGFADCDGNPANGCEVNLKSNASNCGACGHSCGGGTCSSGTCGATVLAVSPGNSGEQVAVDDTSVYWTERLSGTVQKVNKDGSGFTTLVTGAAIGCTSLGGPTGIAVDNDYVYVATYDCDTLIRVKKDGTNKTVLKTFANGAGPASLVVTPNKVYVSLYFAHTIVSLNKDGTGMQTVAVSPSSRTTQLGLDGTNLYYGAYGGPMLQRASTLGGVATALAPSGDSLGLAVDTNAVFFGTASGALRKWNKSGGAPVQLATGSGYVASIVTDANHVYWSLMKNPGMIMRANKDGSNAVTLASGLDNPFGMAIDDKAIYWVHRTNGVKLMKLVK